MLSEIFTKLPNDSICRFLPPRQLKIKKEREYITSLFIYEVEAFAIFFNQQVNSTRTSPASAANEGGHREGIRQENRSH